VWACVPRSGPSQLPPQARRAAPPALLRTRPPTRWCPVSLSPPKPMPVCRCFAPCRPAGALTPPRGRLRGAISPSARNNRFHSNNFKLFSLSSQSPFHLSLTVLVCYALHSAYLALGGVYRPFQAALPSGPTRQARPLSVRQKHSLFPLVGRPCSRESHPLCSALPGKLEPFDRAAAPGALQAHNSSGPLPKGSALGLGAVRFQGWAFPSSLAVTKGITVVFFSSAY